MTSSVDPAANDLADRLASPVAAGPVLTWLGQAGFAIRSPGHDLVLIDPYLSDTLAAKYAGTVFPHERMHPSPVPPTSLAPAVVLCTHAHTDHMDPGTLGPLLASAPDTRVVVPRAVVDIAVERGVPRRQVVDVDAGEQVRIQGVTVTAVPAAHEQLDTDAAGNHRFLGYVLDLDGCRIHHSGDCCPYEGQAALLASLDIDVALLPVNGRDRHRLERGVPGNFHFDEAVDLCVRAGIPRMVAHHFGLFDFNTVDPAEFDLEAAAGLGVDVAVPSLGADLFAPPSKAVGS